VTRNPVDRVSNYCEFFGINNIGIPILLSAPIFDLIRGGVQRKSSRKTLPEGEPSTNGARISR
jgi:hypothetical protein